MSTATDWDDLMISLGLEPSRNPNEAECGTRPGYNRHLRLGEPTCQPCRDANAAYRRARRTAPKDPARLPPITHGTANGAQQHWYRGEKPCDACRDAYNAATRPVKRADARKRRARLQPPQPALPPPVPATTGQLPLPAAVPCGEWPAPRRLARPTVTVPGPDTWQPDHHEETS